MAAQIIQGPERVVHRRADGQATQASCSVFSVRPGTQRSKRTDGVAGNNAETRPSFPMQIACPPSLSQNPGLPIDRPCTWRLAQGDTMNPRTLGEKSQAEAARRPCLTTSLGALALCSLFARSRSVRRRCVSPRSEPFGRRGSDAREFNLVRMLRLTVWYGCRIQS